MDEVVVVFGKTARPGEVKTRLSPPVEPEEAARLYEAFARDVFETVRRYREGVDENRGRVDGVLAWDGRTDDDLAREAADNADLEVVDQGGGTLGDRLRRVCRRLRDREYDRMLIVGTDSPTLSVEHLETAGMMLERNDVVFGPSFDGGYYLVGLDETARTEPDPEEIVFEEIPWSSPAVLEHSWRRAREGDLLCDLLGFWYDVDTFQDLKKARFHLVEYLAERDPAIGRQTRELLESMSLDDYEE